MRRPPLRVSGPRLMSTIAWKFGGWGGSACVARSTKRSSSSSRSSSLWRRSNPIVVETFMSIPGPPHREPPRCPGHTSTLSPQAEQLLVQRTEDVACPLVRVHGEVGPRDVPHEQGVAGQHGPRLRAARGVDQRERRVLGPVPGSVQRAHAHGSQRAAPSRRRRAHGRSPAARRGARGSWRRSRWRAARGRRRGRRGCASRGCARSTRPCSAPGTGTRRCRASGPRPPPGRRPRPRPDMKHSPDRRG